MTKCDDTEETMEDMSERDFAEYLTGALDAAGDENDEEPPHIETFERVGLLTGNVGLVVRYGEAEFQLTIVRR